MQEKHKAPIGQGPVFLISDDTITREYHQDTAKKKKINMSGRPQGLTCFHSQA